MFAKPIMCILWYSTRILHVKWESETL